MTNEGKKPRPSLEKLFGGALYDVEHALDLYATGYCVLPAWAIYEEAALAPLRETINTCHIYLIGLVPKVEQVDVRQESRKLVFDFEILKQSYSIQFDIPDGFLLKKENERLFLEDSSGNRCWPKDELASLRLNQDTDVMDFDVMYIGQAYGQDGSRNALDRLLKHETLQKISVKRIPDGYELTLLLLSIEPNTKLVTVFNPFAQNTDDDGKRIKSGLDKLFNTTEQEQIALYEASLIRYFYPKYNIEFKDSFPSTNLKILRDCYDKDFSAVVAELVIDELPFHLKSEKVGRALYHIARHDLHAADSRKMFFGIDSPNDKG